MTMQRRDFSKLMLGLAVTAGAAGNPLPGLAAVDAHKILQQADTIRLPQTSFAVDVDLKNYVRNKLTDRTKVTVHSRQDGGQFQDIVYVNEPVADRGKIILRNGNILWLYDPAARASVRISARQRLIGNASNGDVVSSNLVYDYQPELEATEVIADGDRQNRECYKLRLTSRDSATPYGAIDFWVDTATSRPVKGKYYTSSGSLIKVAWHRNFSEQMGVERPTEVVIADGFDPNKVTLMQMSSFRSRDLPAGWFRKEWLPKFKL